MLIKNIKIMPFLEIHSLNFEFLRKPCTYNVSIFFFVMSHSTFKSKINRRLCALRAIKMNSRRKDYCASFDLKFVLIAIFVLKRADVCGNLSTCLSPIQCLKNERRNQSSDCCAESIFLPLRKFKFEPTFWRI